MTYGTSHLLIGGGGISRKKYCYVRGGHYMKNKNIGGCVLSAQSDQQKGPNANMCKKMQKII